jgi:hypothetical protein
LDLALYARRAHHLALDCARPAWRMNTGELLERFHSWLGPHHAFEPIHLRCTRRTALKYCRREEGRKRGGALFYVNHPIVLVGASPQTVTPVTLEGSTDLL